MGEVGHTDFHYDGERKRPAYPWKCPACDANNIGRIEEGCPQCSAGKDGKVVGIPKVVRRARPTGAGRLAPTAQPAAAGAGRFDSSTAPRPLRTLPAPEPIRPAPAVAPAPTDLQTLVIAAAMVLQYVHPSTQEEIKAMGQLERAVRPFVQDAHPAPNWLVQAEAAMHLPHPAEVFGGDTDPVVTLPPLAQQWDARTILTLAAALDHFAEQILANITSDDFLSVEEAQDLANQLRATLPEDLDSVLPQISAEEPEGEAQP